MTTIGCKNNIGPLLVVANKYFQVFEHENFKKHTKDHQNNKKHTKNHQNNKNILTVSKKKIEKKSKSQKNLKHCLVNS